MGRSQIDKFTFRPADRLKGLILSAGRDQGKSSVEMARLAGVSKSTYQVMLNKPSRTWPLDRVLSLGKGLKIPIEDIREAIRY